MKLFIHCLSFFFLIALSNAQQTAMFEANFIFEDAIGNKDSIIIGYDTLANATFNPQFGEVEVDSDEGFNPVFDLQGNHDSNYYSNIIKKRISPTTKYFPLSGCYKVFTETIYFTAKNFPVTISWDSLYFQDWCHAIAYITPLNILTMENQDWGEIAPDYLWACLKYNSKYVLTEAIADDQEWEINYDYAILNDGSKGKVYGVQIWFRDFGFYECYKSVSNNDIRKTEKIIITPNPTSDYIRISNISLSRDSRVSILDISGRVVKTNIENERIDVTHLPKGMYFLTIESEEGEILGSEKFVKL